jgi:hypothetical protein
LNKLEDIPFNLLYTRYRDSRNETLEITLAGVRKIKERQFNDRIESIVRAAGAYESEAGSDGVEESAREQLGDFDPDEVQLTDSTISDIKKRALAAEHKLFCDEFLISQKLEWLPYQLLAYFGSWTPVMGENGLYSGSKTLNQNATTDWARGVSMFSLGSRTNIFNKAPRGTPQYSSVISPLVPIILAGFKKYQNIDYSKWSKHDLYWIVDYDLYDAMTSVPPDGLSKTDLLTLRNTGLTDISGPRAGKVQNAVTCAKLNHLATTAIGALPRLAKYMVLQTWCAHPDNRTAYTITNPLDWDTHLPPIVTTSIVKEAATSTKWSSDNVPW